MNVAQLNDKDFGELLRAAVNPDVPEGLARRITLAAVAASSGQDEIVVAENEPAPANRNWLTRPLPWAACVALFMAITSFTQFGSGTDAPANPAGSFAHAGDATRLAAVSAQDTAMVGEAKASVRSAVAPRKPDQVATVADGSTGTASNIESQRLHRVEAVNTTDEHGDTAYPAIQEPVDRQVIHSEFRLAQLPAKPEVYGPVLDEPKPGTGTAMRRGSAVGFGFTGATMPSLGN